MILQPAVGFILSLIMLNLPKEIEVVNKITEKEYYQVQVMNMS
jgi:hypothetical protein